MHCKWGLYSRPKVLKVDCQVTNIYLSVAKASKVIFYIFISMFSLIIYVFLNYTFWNISNSVNLHHASLAGEDNWKQYSCSALKHTSDHNFPFTRGKPGSIDSIFGAQCVNPYLSNFSCN